MAPSGFSSVEARVELSGKGVVTIKQKEITMVDQRANFAIGTQSTDSITAPTEFELLVSKRQGGIE